MRTKRVIVNTASIDDFSKDILNTSTTLTEILDDLLALTIDLDKHYNTRTGKEFQEFLIKYINDSKKDCQSLANYGYTLDKASQIYKELSENIAKNVGGQNG